MSEAQTTRFTDDLLAEYVLGTLDAQTRARIDQGARVSEGLRRRVAEVAEALAGVADALVPAPPDPGQRARLLESVAQTNRFERFATRVAQMIDVTREMALELLAGIDDAARWVAGPAEGVTLYHLDGGTAVANAVVGFIRGVSGMMFPHHLHLGEERVLVLQGRLIEEDGRLVAAGDEVAMPAGSSHCFSVPAGGPDLVYLVVVEEGVDIGGVVFRAGDPRL
jgi:anti-sigma factor ChrR (cupin superfamily)